MVGRIRAVETFALGWGKLSKTKTLKGGGIEKRGGGTKILERGQAGSRGGCLKKGGGLGSLMNYMALDVL